MYNEEFEEVNAQERSGEDVYSKPVRAGKRTYFFDVKTTKGNDYYLTITESKRKVEKDGHFAYDKHKIFLYKEDFDKFAEGLQDLRALRLLESEIGREETLKVIQEGVEHPISMTHYPHDAQWLPELRKRIDRRICACL